MFEPAGLLLFRALYTTLVKHARVRNPWKIRSTGDSRSEAPPPSFPNISEGKDKRVLVYVVSHVDESGVRKVAALLGEYRSFIRAPMARQGENTYIL